MKSMLFAETEYYVFRTVFIVSKFFLLTKDLFQFNIHLLVLPYFDFLDLGKILLNLHALSPPISLVDFMIQP